MNQAVKKNLRAKAIKEYNLQQFGVEKMEFIKVYDVASRKPVTLFVFHYDWAVMAQERVHENEMVQNIEHNGHREGMEKFIKNFISNEAKSFRARKKKQRVQANSLENLCPELMNLKFS